MDTGWPRARANVCRKYLRAKIDSLTKSKDARGGAFSSSHRQDQPVARWHGKTAEPCAPSLVIRVDMPVCTAESQSGRWRQFDLKEFQIGSATCGEVRW